MSKQQEVQDVPPPRVPEFIRKRLERACDEAENPKGMSTHAGIAKVMTCDIRRLLAAEVADAPLQAKYREALREHVLDVFLGVVFCKVCKQVWTEGKKENHKDDCLAK